MSGRILMWEHHDWDSPIRVGGRAFAERFLASGWSVAWINGPLAPWNLLAGNPETGRRRAGWRAGGRRRGEDARLFTYAPLAFFPYRRYPLLRNPWFHRHALTLTLPSLWHVLEREGFGKVDLLWLATGSPMLPLLDRLPHARSIYRLSDDTAAFPDTPVSYRALEEETLRRVDCVIATAASLAERAARFCRRVLLLPNGVDCTRFADPPAAAIRARASDARRRMVYVGALDSWLDTTRIAALARAYPDWEIVLAGPVRMDLAWSTILPNVTFPGPVSPEEVPHLLAHSDVGIIPFLDTPLTRAIHPVKLYEYLAAGLPVVASDLEEIRRIGSPALLARTDADWIEAVRRGVARRRPEEARAFAARNDWSARFAALIEFLGEARERAADSRSPACG